MACPLLEELNAGIVSDVVSAAPVVAAPMLAGVFQLFDLCMDGGGMGEGEMC